MINEELNCGEQVSAVLRNALTGKKRVIDRRSAPKYEIEIKVTDLQTGEIILNIKETR